MTKALSLIIISLMPLILFAQSTEAYKACDEHIFTVVEILPDFKNGKAAFEDSLTQYLKNQQAFPKEGNITFSFIVTREAKVLDIQKEEGDIKFEKAVEEALVSLPKMWVPATQNSYTVCAYIRLSIDFIKNKLDARILPYKPN